MTMIFFDENKNIIRHINGNFYPRPFVNDMVFIQRELYKVVATTVDYDDNQLLVYVESVKR
jgi:thioredoxin-related protein